MKIKNRLLYAVFLLIILFSQVAFPGDNSTAIQSLDSKLEIARRYHKQGNLEAAENEYFEAIKIQNKSHPWILLASFYFESKQYEKAVKVCKKLQLDFPSVSTMASYSCCNSFKFIGEFSEVCQKETEMRTAVKPFAENKSGCYTVGENVFGRTEKDFDMALSMLINQDKIAFAKMAFNGAIGFTHPGIKVFIEDVKMLSAKSQVRLEGTTSFIWVSTDSYSCQ